MVYHQRITQTSYLTFIILVNIIFFIKTTVASILTTNVTDYRRDAVCSGHGIPTTTDFDDLCFSSSSNNKGASVITDEILCGEENRGKDQKTCQCYQCYEGPTCSQLIKNCAVDTRVAELTLTQPWWAARLPDISMPRGLTQRHMSYLGNSRLFVSSIQKKKEKKFVEPPRSLVSDHLNSAIRSLHRTVGNVKNEHEYNVVIGSGGVQMINAAMYAMSKKIEREAKRRKKVGGELEGKKGGVGGVGGAYFAKTPCYSHFKMFAQNRMTQMTWLSTSREVALFNNNTNNVTTMTSTTSTTSTSSTIATSSSSSAIVEIITSPNNPDGKRAVPILQSDPGMMIHDHVYHWPSILNPEEDTLELDEEIMIFSLAKLTGHAASRIGWSFVKDSQVAKDMAAFVWMQSTHASVEAQYGAIRVIRTVLGSLQPPQDASAQQEAVPTDNNVDGADVAIFQQPNSNNFFTYTRTELLDRWSAVETVLASTASPVESVGVRGGLCLWLRCRQDGDEDCASKFRRFGIVAEKGESFGANSQHARICISSDRSTFDLTLDRLKEFVGGRPNDVASREWLCSDCQDHHVD